MPLGLAFMMQRDTHFGPGMWDMVARRVDWMSGWFNRAAPDGVGFRSHRHRQQRGRPISCAAIDPIGPIRRRRPTAICCGSIICPGITA